jgi:hypothetical protein
MNKLVLFICFFILGFVTGILWVSFDPKVTIETRDKLIINKIDLPEEFFKYYRAELEIKQCLPKPEDLKEL